MLSFWSSTTPIVSEIPISTIANWQLALVAAQGRCGFVVVRIACNLQPATYWYEWKTHQQPTVGHLRFGFCTVNVIRINSARAYVISDYFDSKCQVGTRRSREDVTETLVRDEYPS
jgi:hypothetical protein